MWHERRFARRARDYRGCGVVVGGVGAAVSGGADVIEIAGAFNASALETLATIPLHARALRFTVAGCCVAPRTVRVGVNDTSGAPGLAGGGVCRSPGSMAPTYSHPATERGATPRLRSSPMRRLRIPAPTHAPLGCVRQNAGRGGFLGDA